MRLPVCYTPCRDLDTLNIINDTLVTLAVARGRSLTVLAGKTTLSHQQQGADRVSKGQVKSTSDDHT